MKNFIMGMLVAGALLFTMNTTFAACPVQDQSKTTCCENVQQAATEETAQAVEQTCPKECTCPCHKGEKCTCDSNCPCCKNGTCECCKNSQQSCGCCKKSCDKTAKQCSKKRFLKKQKCNCK